MGIRFKRQGGLDACDKAVQAPDSLKYGEPAIDAKGTLYVGDGAGNIVRVGQKLYRGVYTVSGWVTDSNGTYKQAAAVTPVDVGAALTAGANLGPVMTEKSINLSLNKALSKALSIINMGSCVTGNGSVTITVTKKPSCDITCYWYVL
nr:MAG TPA: hypothetical protein [Caudoviricetes sp.]